MAGPGDPAPPAAKGVRTPCYCVEMRKAARRMTARYDAALAPTGVNLAQFSLMRHIAHAGEISLSDLGRRTELDRSTVGRNARLIERLGLVETGPGEDRRKALLRLTEAGRATLGTATPIWAEVQQDIEALLGDDLAHSLRRILHEL